MGWGFVHAAKPAVVCVDSFYFPHVQAVEVFRLALRRVPFPSAQVELDIYLVANIEAIEIFAAISSQLEHDELRVIGVIAQFNHEFSLAESLGYLLCFEGCVKLAADLYSHAHEDNGKSRERKRSDTDARSIRLFLGLMISIPALIQPRKNTEDTKKTSISLLKHRFLRVLCVLCGFVL